MRNLIVFVVLLSVAVWVYAAQEPFVVKVDVDLITLDVGVTDSTGRPLLTLTKDDFEIYEDGKPQEIRNFAEDSTTIIERAST